MRSTAPGGYLPAGHDNQRKALTPRYNRAGALEHVELDGQTYVGRIAYNARGQRTLIAYGNHVMTRYTYDDPTFRLARLRTERGTWADPLLTFQPNGAETDLQDLAYEYDLAGNIIRITDAWQRGAQQSGGAALPGHRRGTGCGQALVRRFAYDPLYRLVEATGRQAAQQAHPAPTTIPAARGSTGRGMRRQRRPESHAT